MVETEPNAIRDESVVVKSHSLCVIARDSHAFGFPPVISTPVEVDVADLVRAGSIYVERIRGASLECTGRRIVQPRGINLISICIAKREADLVASIRSGRAARPYFHRVRTAVPILSVIDLEGFEGMRD